MKIVEINDCIKDYVTAPGKKMNLREVGDLAIYKRIDIPEGEEQWVEPEFKYTKVYDIISKLKLDQVQKFACDEQLSLNFTSSPFQKIVDFKKENFNSLRFSMECNMFIEFNGTHNNTVAHF